MFIIIKPVVEIHVTTVLYLIINLLPVTHVVLKVQITMPWIYNNLYTQEN